MQLFFKPEKQEKINLPKEKIYTVTVNFKNDRVSFNQNLYDLLKLNENNVVLGNNFGQLVILTNEKGYKVSENKSFSSKHITEMLQALEQYEDATYRFNVNPTPVFNEDVQTMVYDVYPGTMLTKQEQEQDLQEQLELTAQI